MVFAPTAQGYEVCILHYTCTRADLKQGIRWTFTSVAIIITIGRLYLRWKHKRMYLDDLFNGLALVCLIGYSASYDLYLESDDEAAFGRLSLAISLLLWTSLYFVKASFLALCWNIFKISTRFRKVWLCVVVYNLLTYIAIIVWVTWPCYRPFDPSIPCILSDEDYAWYRPDGHAYEAALHSTSEALILILPLIWIKSLQMSTAQKLGAASVFAITIIDIVMGLLRNVAQSLLFRGDPVSDVLEVIVDNTLVLEISLAVIVCALPAYKVLLPGSKKRRVSAESPNPAIAEPSTPSRKTKSAENWLLESQSSEATTASMTEMV